MMKKKMFLRCRDRIQIAAVSLLRLRSKFFAPFETTMAPIIERDATRILLRDRLRVHRKEWIVDFGPIIFGF